MNLPNALGCNKTKKFVGGLRNCQESDGMIRLMIARFDAEKEKQDGKCLYRELRGQCSFFSVFGLLQARCCCCLGSIVSKAKSCLGRLSDIEFW